MGPELTTVVLMGGLLFLLAFGVEIAVAMGLIASVGLVFFLDKVPHPDRLVRMGVSELFHPPGHAPFHLHGVRIFRQRRGPGSLWSPG